MIVLRSARTTFTGGRAYGSRTVLCNLGLPGATETEPRTTNSAATEIRRGASQLQALDRPSGAGARVHGNVRQPAVGVGELAVGDPQELVLDLGGDGAAA